MTFNGGSLQINPTAIRNFGVNGTGYQVNTSGSYTVTPTAVTNDVLTLTDGENNQGRYVWFTTPVNVNGNFTASFVYKDVGGNTNNANGMTFVLQSLAAGLNANGGTGGGLGYSGINNKSAFELNIFAGAGGFGIAAGSNGSFPTGGGTYSPVTPVSLTSGDPNPGHTHGQRRQQRPGRHACRSIDWRQLHGNVELHWNVEFLAGRQCRLRWLYRFHGRSFSTCKRSAISATTLKRGGPLSSTGNFQVGNNVAD